MNFFSFSSSFAYFDNTWNAAGSRRLVPGFERCSAVASGTEGNPHTAICFLFCFLSLSFFLVE